MLIIASGIANSISTPLWGKLGDRSSRMVMSMASLTAGLLGIVIFSLMQGGSDLVTQPLFHALVFLYLTIFHSGVRLGRKICLVDMVNNDTRAVYVAISNTIIGMAMLFGGAVGLNADILNLHSLILILGLLSLRAAVYARRLPEVSH